VRTVLLQLERLRRHYEVSVRSYDQVSLLDLSHSLRVWVELKNPLTKLAPKFSTTLAFKTAMPAKRVLKAVRGKRFVFSYMPGGVITYAHKGNVLSLPDFDPETPVQSTAKIMMHIDGALELSQIGIVGMVVEQPLLKSFGVEDQTRCNYAQWLGSEVVRVCYPVETGTLKVVSINREMIMKRVANTLDGSHPSAASEDNAGDNTFDDAVHHLLQYRVAGLPLPYFILLKIAQDILDIAPNLLGVELAQHAK
jgi:hypothetical protein